MWAKHCTLTRHTLHRAPLGEQDAMSRYYSIIFGARSSWTGNTASPQRYGFGSAIDATEEAARTAAAAGTITGCDVTVTGA